MSSLPILNGYRILVTGATGAIGAATATKLVQAGAHVILSARDTVKLEQLAASLPSGTTTVAVYDLMQADGVPEWIRGLTDMGGPLNGIAHTAGIQAMRPLRGLDTKFIDSMFDTNAVSAIMLGKGLRLKTAHVEGAAMVLVGSICARTYGAGNMAYSASKGAVAGASKALAHELLRDRIRVNCVVPSLIESPMADLAAKTVPSESWKLMVDKHLLGAGSVDDVAEAILYLLSDQTRWMTGSELLLDGGFSLH